MWRYYAFRIAGVTLARLPVRLGYLIACLTAYVVYLASPGLRAHVADNMRHVLGREADEAEVKQASRHVFRHAAKNYFDLIKLPHLRSGHIEDCTTLLGWRNFQDAMRKGKGVVLVTAHLGSFDMAAQVLAARHVKTTVLVEPLEPLPLLEHVTALRASKGMTLVPAQPGALNEMMQCLRRGEVVLLACDRDIGKGGLRSSFFGEETMLPSLAVRAAMRTGAAIVPAFALRRGVGRYEAYLEPALDIAPPGNGAVAGNMGKLSRVMEKYIKIAPEQWVVLSPVWPNGR